MQKIRKAFARSIAIATGIIMMATTTTFASPMKDVSANHWAYNEIMDMQRRGLLVTSSEGDFFPNNYVTYFEFSQILAKATGYQDAKVNPNIDPALKAAIDSNYEKQKATIEAHQKNYKHWQKDANPEIAYLIGRGYLEKEDLGKFMSRSTSGVESKRGVRKQEAATYLVRMLHKAETAKNEYVSTGFIDEAKIDLAYRPYVSYIQKLGIVNGNEKGEFGPTEPITRATLSKMLIDTLKIKETPSTPTPPQEPVVPSLPTDKALEGKFTKMISKGDNGYYIVLEIEPAKTNTYSIEPTATILDQNGKSLSLEALKAKIDAKDQKDVIVTSQVQLIGTTEYITKVKIIDGPTDSLPPVVAPKPVEPTTPVTPERPNLEPANPEATYTGKLTGTIESIYIAPRSSVTIRVDNKTKKTFEVTLGTTIYSNLKRNNIAIWDLRLNQEVDLTVVKGEIERLEITKSAPATTVTGTVVETTINGDQIQLRIPYDIATGQTNKVVTINVPMETQILEGTTERARINIKTGMEVVVVYGVDDEVIPEKVIIISK